MPLPDLLALPAVKDLLSAEKERAAKSAIDESRASLDELDRQRLGLEERLAVLRTEADGLRGKIESSRSEHRSDLEQFDLAVQQKFEIVRKDASSFLAEVAFVRAALSPSSPARGAATAIRQALIDAQKRSCREKSSALCARVSLAQDSQAHFLKCCWRRGASGFAPMIFGTRAREGGNGVWRLAIHRKDFLRHTRTRIFQAPLELLALTVSSRWGTGRLDDAIAEARISGDLALVVFDNINLSQLDNTVVPIIRACAEIHEPSLASKRSD